MQEARRGEYTVPYMMQGVVAHPLAGIVAKEALLELKKIEQVVTFPSRRKIVRHGDPIKKIHIIASGAVRIGYENEIGLEVVYCFKDRGTILGFFSFLSESSNHIASVTTIESTSLYSYDRSQFFNIVRMHPSLEVEVKRQISFSFQELLEDRKLANAQTSIRLATILTRLLETQTKLQSRSIGIPLSKADLARRIGSKSETVVRILGDWERKNIVRSKDKVIEILDKEFLRNLIIK